MPWLLGEGPRAVGLEFCKELPGSLGRFAPGVLLEWLVQGRGHRTQHAHPPPNLRPCPGWLGFCRVSSSSPCLLLAKSNLKKKTKPARLPWWSGKTLCFL